MIAVSQAALGTGANLIAAAVNGKGRTFYQKAGQFPPGLCVQRLNCGASGSHPGSGLLLGQPLIVQKPYDFILSNAELQPLVFCRRVSPAGKKTGADGHSAYFSGFTGTGHISSS